MTVIAPSVMNIAENPMITTVVEISISSSATAPNNGEDDDRGHRDDVADFPSFRRAPEIDVAEQHGDRCGEDLLRFQEAPMWNRHT